MWWILGPGLLRHDCSESETFRKGGIFSRVDGVGGVDSATADFFKFGH